MATVNMIGYGLVTVGVGSAIAGITKGYTSGKGYEMGQTIDTMLTYGPAAGSSIVGVIGENLAGRMMHATHGREAIKSEYKYEPSDTVYENDPALQRVEERIRKKERNQTIKSVAGFGLGFGAIGAASTLVGYGVGYGLSQIF